MIPKANQRAGGRQLATHLLNEFDNDRVEVADLRGAIADNLHGAFEEWSVAARVTQCKKYLYSLSVNPDPDQRPVTREEYFEYLGRVEKALGLGEQARAVVFHTKYGRAHCHAVWSRIDADKGKAVQLSFDRQTLRTVTREFAQEHGLELPPGMQQDRLSDRFNNRKKLENLAEKQQEERTGIDKAERMASITDAWRKSDDSRSFVAALESKGYFLARGDQRTFVVVDLYGEIHALARQIEGARTKDVKARLASIPVDKLPDARKAQDFARKQLEKQRAAAPGLSRQAAAQVRADLEKAQRERRAALDAKSKELSAQHEAESEALNDAQDAQEKGIASERLKARPKGVLAFIVRITGIRLLVEHRHRKQDQARMREHARQRSALARRHEREQTDFGHRYRGLIAVEKREKRSLETALRREQFRIMAQSGKSGSVKPASRSAPGASPLTDEQRAHLQAMQRAGLAANPEAARQTSDRSATAQTSNAARAQRALLERFAQNAKDITRTPQPAKGRGGAASTVFNDPDKKPETKRGGDELSDNKPDSLSRTFDEPASRTRETDAAEQAKKMLEEFRRRARQTDGGSGHRSGRDYDRER